MPLRVSHTFEPFGMQHAACLLLFGGLIAAACIVGAGVRGTRLDRPLRLGLGWFGLIFWLAHQAYWLMPDQFTWSRSLPLHFCDAAGLLAPLGLLTGLRWARTLAYFWGTALSIQGFITPVLTEGPALAVFWFFWISHAINVGYALYDVAGGGLVIERRDLLRTLACSWVWITVLFTLNVMTGWNYGYVGNVKTAQPTLVDAMGPWPLRALVVACAGSLAVCVAWLPWWVSARGNRAGRGASAVESSHGL